MICVLSSWELEDMRNGLPRDCRKHRHISRGRAFERSGDARFADRAVTQVFDAQNELIGLIVEIAGRVRWACNFGENWTSRPPRLNPRQMEVINAHLNHIQGMIEAKEQPPRIIKLELFRIKDRLPARRAAICEAVRSFSPSSITAKDSELNAEGALKKRKARGK